MSKTLLAVFTISILFSQIEFSLPSINFGLNEVGSIAIRQLQINNLGNTPVQVDSIQFTSDQFSTTQYVPFVISGFESETIQVEFHPQSSGPFDGSAVFFMDDENHDIELLGWTSILVNSELSDNNLSSESISFSNQIEREYSIIINASTESSWQESGRESNVISFLLDQEPGRRFDAVLFAGEDYFDYPNHVGIVSVGDHSFTLQYELEKSSSLAGNIYIESVQLIPLTTGGVQAKVHQFSPILYGRDLFDTFESNRTDIPLVMYPIIIESGITTEILYRIIFSNEDSRIGLGLAQLMSHYGRTTDIEWIYHIILDQNDDIISEIFQGPSHTTMNFSGSKYHDHPILKNVTANCNFMDNDTSLYRFFPAVYYPENDSYSGESVMDEQPWIYRIMVEELFNEDKVESPGDPSTYDMADPKNYLVVEYEVSGSNVGQNFSIRAKLLNQCAVYSNDHFFPELDLGTGMGIQRTSIELPDNTDPSNIELIRFHINPVENISVTVQDIHALFMLNENYIPEEIQIETLPEILLNSGNPKFDLILHPDSDNLDCTGLPNGTAVCDDCNSCTGGTSGIEYNAELDDCGVCSGENLDMDCNGECFGNAAEDLCGVCDEDFQNDNETCSGCTDENADNYDPYAWVDDESCIYDDGDFVLHVPGEYPQIQTAINFAYDGDTVLVQQGLYHENINFLGKDILVTSVYITTQDSVDILNTIIDGNGVSTVVTFENSETENAELSGFTIQNGYGTGVTFEEFFSTASDEEAYENMLLTEIKAGGISIGQSSPTLSNLIIQNNSSMNAAAGIGIVYGNPSIKNCIIRNNSVITGEAIGGGAFAINGGHVIIENTIISDNFVGTNQLNFAGGGGILVGFTFNELYPTNLELDHVLIIDNASPIGGGLGALSGEVSLNRSVFYGNSAAIGGSISLGEPFGLIVDPIRLNIIHSNILSPVNSPDNIVMGDHCNTLIVNSIIRNNDIITFNPLPNHSELNVMAAYSNISGGWDGTEIFDADPLFINSITNWTLMPNSPCIDAGTDYFELEGDIILDISIDDFSGIAPDMGAFEFESTDGIPGDINADGTLNIIDAVFLVQIILEWIEPTPEQFAVGDLLQDGILDISDILIMIDIILSG